MCPSCRRLVGVIAIYMPNGNSSDLKAQITQKDNTIASLNQNITILKNELSQTPSQTTLAADEAQIANLQQELSDANTTITSANNIISMNANQTLVSQQTITEDNGTFTDAFNNEVTFAGYILVQANSTSNTTYIDTTYSNWIYFNQNVTIGASGTAAFPVLPGTVEVIIGNTDQNENVNNSTVTITYFY